VSAPRTVYAHSGDASIAYQVVGDGPLNLVLANGPGTHIEILWEEPTTARCMRRLASFSRLVLFDRRGTGLSDPVSRPPTLEQQMDDLRAVLDHAGIERTALYGANDLGLCALYAATYPDQVSSLVLSGVAATGTRTMTPQVEALIADALENSWGDGTLMQLWAPSQIGNRAFEEWWARMQRSAVSPGMARQILEMIAQTDLRAVLPTIRVPTLVMHTTENAYIPVELGREVAELIPGARYVEYPGIDTYGWLVEPWIDDLEEFLTGRRSDGETDRVLATVMFTDIVGSTEAASRLGDSRWHQLLDAHNDVVRSALDRWRGTEIKSTGDGFLATFDGPARAVRCASEIIDGVAPLGLDVRTGLHTGECELVGGDVAGMAVHIGARVMSHAEPGEVLASSTVKDLVVGSELQFEDRGSHYLRGVPDEWRLFALAR
jgi:class 3 adenylate cyclase/pimeloyl-ACP methyl ester carboxylesterase